MSKRKIAYVLKGFPRLSETFIANEVRLLDKMGLTLGLFSIKQGDELAADGNLPGVHYLPAVTSLSSTTLRAWLAENFPPFAASQKFWLSRRPHRYLSTLLFALRCSLRYRSGEGSRIKKSFIKNFLLAAHIAEEIEADRNYAHIHAHFCHDATTVAWMVSRLTRLPFSFTAHAKDIYQRHLNPGNLLERKLAATSFAVTCTFANVEYLRRRSPLPQKIHGIYHGLDTLRFGPACDDERQCRTAATAPRRLLTIGRHVEKKGFIYLVDACRILRDRAVSFQLDIIGENGDQSEVLQETILAAGLQNHVSLLSPVPQQALLEYYQAATAFVLPCIVLEDGDRDGIPNVIAEAMACALPVVVTGISGIPELVKDDINGVIVPTRDAHRLANAIERLLRNPQKCRQLGANARHKIEQVFDARHTHLRLRALFEDALAAGN